jgi:hypothetical protein
MDGAAASGITHTPLDADLGYARKQRGGLLINPNTHVDDLNLLFI